MKLDISQIKINYLVRIIVLAAFTFKNEFRSIEKYQNLVQNFINNKFGDIKIKIISPNISDEQWRESILDEILFNKESDRLVEIIFSIFSNEKRIIIDLNNESKYELFLYG